jgi:hypothetical protein
MIAADIIRDAWLGRTNADARLFSFDRAGQKRTRRWLRLSRR